MTPICNFVDALTVARKSFKEIKKTVKKVYGDKALKRIQIYDIVKNVKEGKTGDRPEGFQHQEANQKLGVRRRYHR
jgi:hypothetical protein